MPAILYTHVQNFLSRGVDPAGNWLHDLAGNGAAPVAPGWNAVPPGQGGNLHADSLQFLPHCTIGKGERAIHFLLFKYLASHPRYCVIPEFSALGSGKAFDLLVVEAGTGTPIAVIELKHYSVHQTGGVHGLLSGIDADYPKTDNPIPLTEEIKMLIPLIQIGLLTAIYGPVIDHPHHVSFLGKYVTGGPKGSLASPHSTYSNQCFIDAMGHIQNWWNLHPQNYINGNCDWGPEESFTLHNLGIPALFPVVGRVGYVSLLKQRRL